MEDSRAFFTLVDRLVDARPLTAASTARLVGRPLQPASDASTERTLIYVARDAPEFERVELRLAGPKSSNDDQLLILELNASRCLRLDDVRRHFGPHPEPGVPSAHQPSEAPTFFRYPLAWGTLAFGFARSGEGCLKSVVLDVATAK